MKITDVIIIIVALILAYFIINILWLIARFVIQVAIVLIVAYILYLFLKKLL